MFPPSKVNFSQVIQLDWLDLAANCLLNGKKIREVLPLTLEKQAISPIQQQAIIYVIQQIWTPIPNSWSPFREEALKLWQQLPKNERFVVHWGMLMVTSTVFTTLATQVGRLLSLQTQVSIQQIQRRMYHELGDQLAIKQATEQLIACWVEWTLLIEVEKNIFTLKLPKQGLSHQALIAWLLESTLIAHQTESISLHTLNHSPALFPFNILTHYFQSNERLETSSQGVNEINVNLNNGYRVNKK